MYCLNLGKALKAQDGSSMSRSPNMSFKCIGFCIRYKAHSTPSPREISRETENSMPRSPRQEVEGTKKLF